MTINNNYSVISVTKYMNYVYGLYIEIEFNCNNIVKNRIILFYNCIQLKWKYNIGTNIIKIKIV